MESEKTERREKGEREASPPVGSGFRDSGLGLQASGFGFRAGFWPWLATIRTYIILSFVLFVAKPVAWTTRRAAAKRYTLHPTLFTPPSTPHHTFHTLHPPPSTPHPPTPILHLTPSIPHPTPSTLHPAPYTLHPTPYTLHARCAWKACAPR